jgi:hypothetical protein
VQPTDSLGDGGESKTHLNSHVPQTGTWIQSTYTNLKWDKSTPSFVIWIKGIPGTLKSCLFGTSITAKFARTENRCVLYIFFRRIVASNHRPITPVRDWLSQVLIYSPWLQPGPNGYVENRRSMRSSAFANLWSDLGRSLSMLPEVYCMSDAIDEMDIGNIKSQNRVRHFFLRLAEELMCPDFMQVPLSSPKNTYCFVCTG